MAKFRVEYQGKKYDIEAPDQDTAIEAFADSMGIAPATPPAGAAPGAQAVNKAVDPYADLPYPGNPNFDPVGNAPAPNYAFGTSSSSTLDPLPAIAAFGNNLAAKIPVAGPYLKRLGENVDAFVTGQTPEQRARVNAAMSGANPIAAETGKVVGAVAPYAVASGVPLLNQAMGFSGPLLQRLFMTAASQQAINTGDNMANGQPFPEAAANAVIPSLLAAPAAIIGPSGAKMTPSRAAALDLMKKESIPLTGGQASMNKRMMYWESQLGGQAAQSFQEKQLRALTRAALKYAGVADDISDPAVLRKAYDDAGKRFETLASVTKPRITAPLYRDMLKVVDDYAQLKGTPAPLLESTVQRIGNMAANNGGVLTGEQYKTLITDLRKYADTASDIELKMGLGELREIVDDAVEQSVGGKTREAWRDLRAKYRNLIVVTDAVGNSGDMALQGIIDPVALNNAVIKNVGRRNYAKGYGDLNELSRAARLVMPKLPDSGTASRTTAEKLGQMATPAGAASFMLSGGDMPTALAVGGLTAASPLISDVIGRTILSKPGREIIAGNGTKIPATVSRGIIPLLLGQ